MDGAAFFVDSYRFARDLFRREADAAGFDLDWAEIDGRGPAGERLAIDAAVRRGSGDHAVVATSGLHGVEGFFGSAVQRALLADARRLERLSDATVVLIHALNPFGFAWRRRWNEDNVDLNRSFMPADAPRPEIPETYLELIGWLNPSTPPAWPDPFPLEMLSAIARRGLTRLRMTLPIGQYEYPKAMFFGGHAPSATQEILGARLVDWVGAPATALHLDFHTGLGPKGAYKLLLGRRSPPDATEAAALTARFGEGAVSGVDERESRSGVAYPARGLIDDWVPSRFPATRYRLMTAEFGTYPPARVLQALRAENRAHHWGRPDAEHAWTKSALLETFAPADRAWRRVCVAQGLDLIEKAAAPLG